MRANPDTIRRALIEADLVGCMVALPGQLFSSTQIPVCLWFLTKNKNADAKRGFRDRRQLTLVFESYIRCAPHPNPWHN